tara:strand:- start:40732 stop:41592 length:861 start_codon:yes stop_codon:yes gene_type:complete
MQWIKHDTNANQDAKLKRMRMKYGLEGYGLYWYCLELVGAEVSQTKLTFELEHDAEIIAFDTGIHHERVNEMMAYMVNLGLFEENNGVLYCLTLAKRLDKSMTSNPAMRKIIGELRTGGHDQVMTESDSVMTESDNVMQDKIRIDKNNNLSASAEPKPSKYKFEDIDLDFSKQMYQRILGLNATYKEPNYEAWANAIRLARDQDKRSIDDLWDVFDWANRDSFWQTNILSPKKLRDKFDDLVIKMNSAKNSPPPIQSAGQGSTDWAEDIGQPYLPNEPKQGLIDHD